MLISQPSVVGGDFAGCLIAAHTSPPLEHGILPKVENPQRSYVSRLNKVNSTKKSKVKMNTSDPLGTFFRLRSLTLQLQSVSEASERRLA